MSESWEPNFNFEDEMLAIQPDCDLIFPDYGRIPESLAAETLKDDFKNLCLNYLDCNENPNKMPEDRNKELNIVSKIREMMPTKNFIGRRLTETDLDEDEGVDREAETIAMIRNVGSNPCVDVPLASNNTLPTIYPKQGYKISNGHPILFDSEYFKLKPRSSNASSDSANSSSIELDDIKNSSKADSEDIAKDNSIEDDNKIHKKNRKSSKNSKNENLRIYQNINFMTPKELYKKKRGKV